MGKRVTLSDIARHTGLAISTISTVLNGHAGTRIPSDTAQRVHEAAELLGYAPDPAARGLRTGRSGIIGFISDEVTVTRYASAMIRGLIDTADTADYVVVMSETDHREERLERALEVLRTRRSEGLLFGLMSARRIDLPPLGGAPAIVVNGVAEGVGSVLPDEERAGREAVEHLVRRGHRRLALIGRSDVHLDPAVSVTIGDRMAGIDAAMAEAGLAFEHEVEAVYWEPEVSHRGAAEILDHHPEVTAIIALNDRMALGVYQAAQERGLSIPADVSVMSFDDEQLASYLDPPVTTMRLPYLEMGALAMERLLESVVSGAPIPDSRMLVPIPLIERGSVREIRGPGTA
ncbi:LacI family DNA-binding transcriptional regulator [Leucobacter sp. CSA1]|uniref:LacI family DNA-binding transcriptional regulator n=1 Tax=Leucobacter chromiisoli TaxID=2796471 RepID=A0A934Q9Q0_9MICO|nr:LacI family DNA-binding transcriptional regulator [Leucobacter chromiisoli]MBK0419352.1 LacI family DNA-binding transcriptional regulator [Leucobacter chromiisoli]